MFVELIDPYQSILIEEAWHNHDQFLSTLRAVGSII